jgi:acyl-CoA synthetase (AMP-forming)/AMP-acid ligase II
MYEIDLKESLFPEQSDAELWDITVGKLLRDIAATYPCNEAVFDEFPMTGSGKIQKFAIREKWLNGKYGVEIHDNSN